MDYKVESLQNLETKQAALETQVYRMVEKFEDFEQQLYEVELASDQDKEWFQQTGAQSTGGVWSMEAVVMSSTSSVQVTMSSAQPYKLEGLVRNDDGGQDWYRICDLIKSEADQWALYTKAVLDRTRLALADKAEHYQEVLQPSAEYLGALLGVEQWAINIFTEEMIRAGSAAPLSLLLNRLDPILRNIAQLGCWQIISPMKASGFVATVDTLLGVQNRVYDRSTILIANRVKGEEEIPDGVVAVLTPDMPDVLSHVSVRARNSKVCFATCFDQNILSDLRSKEGKAIFIQPTSSDLIYTETNGNDLMANPAMLSPQNGMSPGITLKKKHFSGRYAVSADQFSSELVGSKSRNIAFLRGKVPSWVKVPTSVALPFGVFEMVLIEDMNKGVANKLADLNKLVAKGDFSKLSDIRENILQLKAPPQVGTTST
eukprot:Gb_00444 [translate_table: standard]